MKIKKYRKLALKKSTPDLEDFSLYCDGLVAEGGTCQWVGTIRFVIDSGADMPVFPRALLESLGLDDLEVVDTIEMETADGNTSQSDVVLVDLRLITAGGDKAYVLSEVPCIIVEEGSEALLGASVLQYYAYAVVAGELKLLQPVDEMFEQLDSWEPTERTDIVRTDGGCKLIEAGNIDSTDNATEPAKPPPGPSDPGMQVKPLADAFGKPSKPQGPKKSR